MTFFTEKVVSDLRFMRMWKVQTLNSMFNCIFLFQNLFLIA